MPPEDYVSDTEADNVLEIDGLRAAIEGHMPSAVASLRAVTRAVEQLCSPQVYDVEYVEGVGPDVLEHLRLAALHLRAAKVIVATVPR